MATYSEQCLIDRQVIEHSARLEVQKGLLSKLRLCLGSPAFIKACSKYDNQNPSNHIPFRKMVNFGPATNQISDNESNIWKEISNLLGPDILVHKVIGVLQAWVQQLENQIGGIIVVTNKTADATADVVAGMGSIGRSSLPNMPVKATNQ